MYKLSYFIDGQDDPIENEFKDRIARRIFAETVLQGGHVWVLTSIHEDWQDDVNAPIFVSDDVELLAKLVRVVLKKENHIHLQPYKSYEAAYEVALSMKKNHPKCYE